MTGPKFARRNVEYRIAMLTLMHANAEQLDTEKALKRLQDFRRDHATSWQINQVMPLVAQLQIAGGDVAAAEETFKEMSEMESLPADVRRDAELMVIQVLVRAGKAEQAQKKLDALSAKPGNPPTFASRIKMARAEVLLSQKKLDQALPLLQQVVKENNDKTVKAQAHNAIGECLFKANRYNEAMWEFLWVDAVFNQDKSQHAKAALLPREDLRAARRRGPGAGMSAATAERSAAVRHGIPTKSGGRGEVAAPRGLYTKTPGTNQIL